MMSPVDMQKMDKAAIEEYKIPGILLMEHAANSIFMYLRDNQRIDNVCIICGPGNNGGDGLALARLLTTSKCKNLRIILLVGEDKLSEDGLVYFNICKELDIRIDIVTDNNKEEIISDIYQSNTIVDAIFGTGLKRQITNIYKEVIEAINISKAHIVSVDIPSGIDGETGKIQGIAVSADITITFVLPKKGLYLYPALLYTGDVKVVDIGMPQRLIEESTTNMHSIEESEMKELLPKRSMRSNKGTYGKVLVIGGSRGMSGAVTLTSLAAYKVGCGIVTAAVPSSLVDVIESKLTEVMSYELSEKDGKLEKESVKLIGNCIENYDVIAIGPGIGRNIIVKDILIEVLKSNKPCIIDADGLFYLNEVEDILRNRRADTIITPHPGEMSKLTGYSIAEILEDPVKIAMSYSRQQNTITVLKLERIVISDTLGNIYINRCGNTGMAKGGSGDVLTGIIAGLMAQSKNPIDSAVLGSFVHARSGEIAASRFSAYSMMPSDLIDNMSEVFKRLECI